MILLEKTTQQQGFNNYQVNQFDGHPQNALVVGVDWGFLRIGMETEFWVETFAQHEVPYDLRNAERTDRITCEQLRHATDLGAGLFGCVEAQEEFNFLPITLQISKPVRINRHFRFSPGYGIGFLAGSAHVGLNTSYFGAGAAENDRIRFEVWPGVNPVHKLFGDFEWLFWKRMGLEGRIGWRYTHIQSLSLKNQQGSSRIFSIVFPDAKENSRLYIQETGKVNDDQLFIGSPAQAQELVISTGTRVKEVEGDFSGWFGAVKFNFYFREIL